MLARAAAGEAEAMEHGLELRGVAPEEGAFGHLAFQVRAPWMDGWLEMRMPETLHTDLGLHFIDHARGDMPPLSELDPPPVWTRDPETGALAYEARTEEGIVFAGEAAPEEGGVRMTFRVRNETGGPRAYTTCQMCLDMSGSDAFGQRHDLSRTYAVVDSEGMSLAKTTPGPEQKGRKPWVLVPTTRMAEGYTGPRDNPDGWWVVDQAADLNLIYRVSQDREHLVGVAWDEDETMLMTNTNIPCLHAGPNEPRAIEAGGEAVWRGFLYLMPNDPAALMNRYRADVARWSEAAAE
jgi:hypothetical protein